MPVTVKRKETSEAGEEQDASFTTFVYKARWFVLAQTDGEAMQVPTMPTWDADKALAELAMIQRIAFTETDGNCQGYAKQRQIAINPIAQLPHKTHSSTSVLTSSSATLRKQTSTIQNSRRETSAK